jgi:hypothetical protein
MPRINGTIGSFVRSSRFLIATGDTGTLLAVPRLMILICLFLLSPMYSTSPITSAQTTESHPVVPHLVPKHSRKLENSICSQKSMFSTWRSAIKK